MLRRIWLLEFARVGVASPYHPQEDEMESETSEFLYPLAALRLKARQKPTLRHDETWVIEMTAAIAAARACGVPSATLDEYEQLLRV